MHLKTKRNMAQQISSSFHETKATNRELHDSVRDQNSLGWQNMLRQPKSQVVRYHVHRMFQLVNVYSERKNPYPDRQLPEPPSAHKLNLST